MAIQNRISVSLYAIKKLAISHLCQCSPEVIGPCKRKDHHSLSTSSNMLSTSVLLLTLRVPCMLLNFNDFCGISRENAEGWENSISSCAETAAEPRRRVTLKRSINECTTFNSRLPVELVAAIFEMCCNSLNARRTADLQAICAVCCGWRSTAFLTSSLWCTIRYHSDSPKRAVVETLSLSIERSKSAPLFIEISALGEISPEIESVAKLLRPHLWRCHLLDLTFSQESTARSFLPLPQTMPFLRNLSYTIESCWRLPIEPTVAHTPAEISARPLRLFDTNVAKCSPQSIQIYVPNSYTLIIPNFSDLSSLKTLGLALNMPSAQMLDIAAQAPQLRSLDLMVHHPDPVEHRVLQFAYPKLERQRIAGDGCTSLVRAPHLRSLTLVDEASMRAVDQLMWSRTIAADDTSNSTSPLFPRLRRLTFVFGGASDVQSSGRFDNLARFIREHDELSSLHVVAGWAPVPYLLDVSLLGSTSRSRSSRLACSKLELLKLDMVLPVEFNVLASVLGSLAVQRPSLRIELTVGSILEIPNSLQTISIAYPGRVVISTRR